VVDIIGDEEILNFFFAHLPFWNATSQPCSGVLLSPYGLPRGERFSSVHALRSYS